MRPHGCFGVLNCLYASLCVLMVAYRSECVFMGPYRSVCVRSVVEWIERLLLKR